MRRPNAKRTEERFVPDPLETDENLNNQRLASLMVAGLSIGFRSHEQVLEGAIELWESVCCRGLW